MTTVVCTREYMVSDSQATKGNTKSSVPKIFRQEDMLIGVAGDYGSALEFVRWIFSGCDEEFVPGDLTEVDALVLTPKGIYEYSGGAGPMKIRGPYAAIGSGHQFALGALMMGATPQQAVRVAAKGCCYTGGRVITKKL